MRSNNGLQARFAATSQLLYSDIWPIWLVVVPGVVAVVRREFAVQTNRFRKFGRCNAIVSVKGVVVRTVYCTVTEHQSNEYGSRRCQVASPQLDKPLQICVQMLTRIPVLLVSL